MNDFYLQQEKENEEWINSPEYYIESNTGYLFDRLTEGRMAKEVAQKFLGSDTVVPEEVKEYAYARFLEELDVHTFEILDHVNWEVVAERINKELRSQVK